MMPVPCELVKRNSKTCRVKLPNGDVIKVPSSRVVSPPVGGALDVVSTSEQSQDVVFFVGQRLRLTDGVRRLNAKVSRVDEDGLPYVMWSGKEFALTPNMLGDDVIEPAPSVVVPNVKVTR